MKKVFKAVVLTALVGAGLLSAGKTFAACLADSGICWGSGQTTIESPAITGTSNSYSLYSRTLAQINSVTPTSAGQLIYCSDCVNSAVCVSSGTGKGAYVASSSPLVHCDVR